MKKYLIISLDGKLWLTDKVTKEMIDAFEEIGLDIIDLKKQKVFLGYNYTGKRKLWGPIKYIENF